MKNVIIILLSGIKLLFGSYAYASGGSSGIIPFWQTDANSNTAIYVSNISNVPVTVNAVLYDQNGAIYNEGSESGNQIFGEVGALTSGGTTVDANETIIIQINSPQNSLRGYGLISWESTSSTSIALIANSRLQSYNNAVPINGHAVYPVNSFNPF